MMRECLAVVFERPGRATGAWVLGALGAFLAALEPLFLLVFANEVVYRTDLNLLACIVVCMTAVAVASHYATAVARTLRARAGQRLVADLRRRIVVGWSRPQARTVVGEEAGRRISQATTEVDAVDDLHEGIVCGGLSLIGIALLLTFSFLVDAALSLLLLVPLPAAAGLWTLGRSMQRSHASGLRHHRELVDLAGRRPADEATESEDARDVRREFAAVADDLGADRTAMEARRQWCEGGLDVLQSLVLAALLLAGGMRVIREEGMTAGALLAVYSFAELQFRELRALLGLSLSARLGWESLCRSSAEAGSPLCRGLRQVSSGSRLGREEAA